MQLVYSRKERRWLPYEESKAPQGAEEIAPKKEPQEPKVAPKRNKAARKSNK